MASPYRSHSAYFKERFGEKVRRLSLDAGFGCPHRAGGRGAGGCLFCDSRGSGSGEWDRGVSTGAQGRALAAAMARAGVHRYIAYFQAFTGTLAPVERLRRIYREAVAVEGVVGLTVSTRPDALPDPVLALLASFGPGGSEGGGLDVWVEIGLQSACDATLARINRGHDVACFDQAVERASRFGLKIAAHVILGLPGEGPAETARTAEHLAALPVAGVKLHHLYVVEGSPLAEEYRRGRVPLLSAEEYVPLAADFIRRLRPDMIVLRLCGSAPQHRLVAPLWKDGSAVVAARVARWMESRGYRQGDLWSPAPA